MRKSQKKFVGFGILSILIILGIVFAMNGAQMSFQTCNVNDAQYILNEQYGKFECMPDFQGKEQSSTNLDDVSFFWKSPGSWIADKHVDWAGWVQCGDTEITSDCDIYVETTTGWGGTGPTGIWYRLCDTRNPEVCGTWQTTTSSTGVKIFIDNVPDKKFVNVYVLGYFNMVGTPKITEYYYPYVLWKEAASGQKIIVNDACTIPSTEIQSSGLCYEGCDNNIDYYKTSLAKGEIVNFVEDYSMMPIDLVKTDTDGTKVVCERMGQTAQTSKVNLYNLNGITLSTGCYAVKGDFKKQADCCPGESLATLSCGLDFKWVEGTTPNCITLGQCTGGGQPFIDTNDPTYHTYKQAMSCTNGNCIYTSWTQECTMNNQCAENEICDKATGKCEGISPPPGGCGNHVCEATESILTCPGDCMGNINIMSWLPYILFPLLGFLVAYREKRDKIAGAIGLILGIIFAVLVVWLLANPIITALGVLGIVIVGLIVLVIQSGIIQAVAPLLVKAI